MMNCLLAGVGGQGTVLASRLLAQAALEMGESARTAETIGMAQRGGCVVSHVRIGGERTGPLIPRGLADVLIGFEPGEAARCLAYLRPDGLLISAVRPVQPVRPYDPAPVLDFLRAWPGPQALIDGDAVCRAAGSPRKLNTSLLGAAAASGRLGVTGDALEAALRALLPERLLPMNLAALRAGAEAYRLIERERMPL